MFLSSLYVKYCDERYNITKNCRTIKFGTLEEYSKLETSDPRADSTEGVLSRTLDNEEFKISPNDPRFPNFFSGDVYVQSMKGVQGVIKTNINCHVFCMTQLEPSQSNVITQHKEHFKVNSHWEIDDAKIGIFLNYLIMLYRNSLTIDDFLHESQEIIKNNFLGVNLEIRTHSINYVDTKSISIRDNNSDLFDRAVFHKSDKFRNEQEYRIAFIVKNGNNNQLLHIKNNQKIVNIIPGYI